MLKMTTMEAYGVSRIGDRDVITFSAHADAVSGSYSVTKHVDDPVAYAENKDACDEDMTKFETTVVAASAGKTE